MRHLRGLVNQRRVGGGIARLVLGDRLEIARVGNDHCHLAQLIQQVHRLLLHFMMRTAGDEGLFRRVIAGADGPTFPESLPSNSRILARRVPDLPLIDGPGRITASQKRSGVGTIA